MDLHSEFFITLANAVPAKYYDQVIVLFQFRDNGPVLVIANPAAGRRRRLRVALSAWPGETPRVVETRAPGDARRLAQAAVASGVGTILAAGGDGTVNEIVNGILAAPSKRPPMIGVLPLGTANVLARELGLSLDPAQAARMLAGGRPMPAHLGLVNGRHFVMMAGIGFDAHVVACVRPQMKRRFGRLAYAMTTASLWLRGPERRYRILLDGKEYDVGSIVIGNGRHYAGGFVACPAARLDQPQFELCILPSAERSRLMATALSLGIGHIAWAPGVRHVTSTSLHVSGPDDEPIQADGEIVGSLPATFSVAPTTIDLLAPAARA
jgi:YegS/Rv2252/BmrU family lipid kinase